MKTGPSTKLMNASFEMRRMFAKPLSTSGKIRTDIRGEFLSNRSLTVPGLFAGVNLTPPPSRLFSDIAHLNSPGSLIAAPVSMFERSPEVEHGNQGLRIAFLSSYKGHAIAKEGDNPVSIFLGDFIYQEIKPGRYAATVYFMTGEDVAQKVTPPLMEEGILTPSKGLTGIETLYAAALINFEGWLGVGAFEETHISHPRLGTIYELRFARKIPNARDILEEISPRPIPPHTMN
jgi:hypothetical protein